MRRFSKLLMLLGLLVLHTLPITGTAAPPNKPLAAAPKSSSASTLQQDAVSKPKSLPAKRPEAESTVRSLSPAQLSELANRRYLDPKRAKELYEQGMKEAQNKFPDLFGKSLQEHHVIPKYLGGPKEGKTVQVDRAYHQLITNAFREEFTYNQGFPNAARLAKILEKVYSRYPLLGVHF